MSLSFRADQYVKVMETGETVHAGGVELPLPQELGHVRVVLYKHGAGSGNERLRVKLYHDAELTKLYAASDWARLSDIENLGTYWIGWLRFDFARQWLRSDQVYHVAIESDGYTRVADTFYLSFALDRGFQSHGEETALALELHSYREASAS